MEQLSNAMYALNSVLWGPLMIVLLVGTGLYLTIRLRFIQLRHLRHSLECISGKFDNPAEQGDISHFQALCAALSATIGTGNIAGVATAIALGGPGAIFWMWITALVGMATKYASCSLAIKYRVIHPDGTVSGGPMYFLRDGMNQKFLGMIFALCAGLASFGIGSAVQANSLTDGLLTMMPKQWIALKLNSNIPLIGGIAILKPLIGLLLALMVAAVVIGGIRRIAKVASKIVPFMCTLYVGSAIVILAMNYSELPAAFGQIFRYAFTPLAAGAGFVGMVVNRTITKGVARGVFSNESGLGSAPIAHAAAKTKEMAREGFVAMLGPFIDTIIICTMTALVIITSGLWQVKAENGQLIYGPSAKGAPMKMTYNGQGTQVIGTVGEDPQPFLDSKGQPYLLPTGASLTIAAFEKALPHFGYWVVPISLIFFAYSTMISWSYYGDRCFEYLFGPKVIKPYRYLFCIFAFLGAVGGLDLVWLIADNLNALMALPNLIALVALAPVVTKETKSYLTRMQSSNQ